MKSNSRFHEHSPNNVVLIHGGPGAAGSLTPLANELSGFFPVSELFQTENSVSAQVEELKMQISTNCKIPVFAIGHSWGAWLSLLTAAHKPDLFKHLILVACPPFEDRFVPEITKRRLDNMSFAQRVEYECHTDRIVAGKAGEKELQTLGKLTHIADSYQLISNPNIHTNIQWDIFEKVWAEAAAMRTDGYLLKQAAKLTCPVSIIHGENDPHPVMGAIEPLKRLLPHFDAHVLEKCGHYPWEEKYTKDKFVRIVRQIVSG